MELVDGRRRRKASTAAGSVVDQIHAQLRDEILDGVLTAGSPIVVATLAERLGASAIPIREALRRLEGEALVEFENNRGARVTTISFEDLRDIYMARRVVEPAVLAASVAAAAIDMERLQDSYENMAAAYRAGTQRSRYRWHWDFHEGLVRTGTSPRLERFAMALLQGAQRYLRLVPGLPTEAETLVEVHRAIYDAVRAGDADDAAAAMIRHMDYSIDHLELRRGQWPGPKPR